MKGRTCGRKGKREREREREREVLGGKHMHFEDRYRHPSPFVFLTNRQNRFNLSLDSEIESEDRNYPLLLTEETMCDERERKSFF